MSDYSKVVIESYRGGRLSISALTDTGSGHGHRLAGAKFAGQDLAPTIVHELDVEDVDAIRGYLRIFDQIHGATEPVELHALTEALDWYRRALRIPGYAFDLPHQVERRNDRRAALIAACTALLSSLNAPAVTS